MGVLIGNLFLAFSNWLSFTCSSTNSFKVSIQLYPTPSENCSFCLYRISLGKYSSNAFRRINFSILLLSTILFLGFIAMATSMKSLSKKGTLASTPHAAMDLLALRQSYKCRLFIFLTVSS